MITGKQIKAARALAGWTQLDLACQSGVGVATIKKIESGTTDPRRSTLESIETAFAVKGIDFAADGIHEKIRHKVD